MNSKVNLIVLDTIVGCTHIFVCVIYNTKRFYDVSNPRGYFGDKDHKEHINTLERNYRKLYKIIINIEEQYFFSNAINLKHEKTNQIKNMCIIEINRFEL